MHSGPGQPCGRWSDVLLPRRRHASPDLQRHRSSAPLCPLQPFSALHFVELFCTLPLCMKEANLLHRVAAIFAYDDEEPLAKTEDGEGDAGYLDDAGEKKIGCA